MLMDMVKGLIIGVSMLIPGVSGGTIAIICGIYYKLITSVDTFFENPKDNLKTLASVAIGGVIGVLLFSRPVLMLYEKYNVPMLYLFIGAVLGSLPVLIKSAGIKKVKIKWIVYPIMGMVCIMLIDLIPRNFFNVEAEGITGYIILFVISIFLATPLVLPGISFSYMLLILGLYSSTLTAIKTVDIIYLIPMCLGIVIGTFLTARIIRIVLRKYPIQTYLVIIGFVIMSLRDIFPGLPTGNEILPSVVLFIISFVAMFKFSK